MSYLIRPRRWTVTVAALAGFAALPLAAVPALAAGNPPSVMFRAGGLGLPCASRPDPPRLTIQAEQTVRLINQLGLDATLTIDKSPETRVSDGETIEVQIHRGPVSIGMIPECTPTSNAQFEELTVEVTAVATSASPSARPTSTQRPNARPSAQPGTQTRTKDGSSGVPAQSSDPLLSDVINPPSGSPVPGVGIGSPATVVHRDGGSRDQKMAEAGPAKKERIGLLAIIATVCVVGASAGAIRAIITQRAT
jgi:hypothetical protein